MSTDSHNPTLLWFRRDFRLTDNPALAAAIERGAPILPIYVYAPEEENPWAPGGASKWWLHHALQDIQQQLRSVGLELLIQRSTNTLETLQQLIHESNAGALYWNRLYEPAIIERDQTIKQTLNQENRVEVRSFNGALLHEPHTISNKSGTPYKVFTPYWKAIQPLPVDEPVRVPLSDAIPFEDSRPDGLPLEDLSLLPRIRWDEGIQGTWDPTREGARKQCQHFLDQKASRYPKDRDYPSVEGTSRLSPYLHYGQIGPREIVEWTGGLNPEDKGALSFIREVVWREFGHHLLYHFPHTPTEPLQPDFAHFPWEEDPDALKRWQKGATGFPIVDAAMRELWETGWMHNRARMIVASFLVKDLRITWLEGAKWFWDTLVDADLANNTLGWQWAGGCGADAAPYFRVFNPTRQATKFDPKGEYIARYCPELAKLPVPERFAPWEASESALHDAGVQLGTTYPKPMVDHAEARKAALQAYEKLKYLREKKSPNS